MKYRLLYRILSLVPPICISLFVLLYIVATIYYSGGSASDNHSAGFNWCTNYWCDLISPVAKNGAANNSYAIAVTAMIILAAGLIIFWMVIPPAIVASNRQTRFIIFSGIASMLTGLFLLTGIYHDLVLTVAGVWGMISFLLLMRALYKRKNKILFLLELFCLLLCVLNNYIYYSGDYIEWLAIVQKLTFLVFLSWFMLMSGMAILIYTRADIAE